MEYSRNFGSNFPGSFIPLGTKKDIDDTVKDLITQYYSYIDSGNITDANMLYENNKEVLEDYKIDMAYVNRLEEEIYNVGLNILKCTKNIISDVEPIEQSNDGFWYQEY